MFVILTVQNFPIASNKVSATGAPTSVAFLPSPQFSSFHSIQQRLVVAQIQHAGAVTGVSHDAKTKAASSGRSVLSSFTLYPTFICFHFAPSLVRSVTVTR